ncbi:MAG: MFS transporter [Treponema sp.]|nr:MFS transporter [Treponema sp.]
MTALAILGISFTGNYWLFLLCAVPLGLGAGSIDTALNNYVAIHYSASQMSFLHCFYGIGVTVSPFILSKMISSDAGWRGGYRNAFFIQAGIAFVLLLALPLWKKAFSKSEKEDDVEEPEARVLTFKEMFAIPGVRQMCLLFLSSVAIEATCGSWGATFLVENKGLQPELAARTIMFLNFVNRKLFQQLRIYKTFA